ncbi:MAG: ABC transporter permease [Chloroflexi bacterium]|nr:ABC transporter permease [Chloroflexota bacterium]|tara:strand:+ start:178 stop:1164 length:987 start_codon:yes stop_codon:yes gene_type:complete
MLRFAVRRIALLFPMLFIASVITFAIIQAPPGDFLDDYIAELMEQGEAGFNRADVDYLREQYGLNDPLPIQYGKWFLNVLQWDLGLSLEWNKPVTELLNQRLLMTVILGLFTITFTWTMAIPIGILSAVKQYSWWDYIWTFISYLGVATPNFMIALVVIWMAFSYFGANLVGLFSSEYIDAPWSIAKVIDMLKHIWVPMLIVGTSGTARLTRIVRANLLDELSKPYVETARAKGVSELKLLLKYPTRIALNPFVSTAGWELSELFSGSLIVATVMGLPTMGPLLLRALISQDMYMAGSMLLILTYLTLVGTLISDLALGLMDPRIRQQ